MRIVTATIDPALKQRWLLRRMRFQRSAIGNAKRLCVVPTARAAARARRLGSLRRMVKSGGQRSPSEAG